MDMIEQIKKGEGKTLEFKEKIRPARSRTPLPSRKFCAAAPKSEIKSSLEYSKKLI
jgi:hypothetical protein